MNEVADYLRISEDYCKTLGGLRWSPDGEAVEFADGTTFAFSGEIVGFLEGFAARRPLVDFNHVLHLLYLLRQDRASLGRRGPLQEAFHLGGKVHRNAGAFGAALCADVPSVPNPPPTLAIWQQVVLRWYRIMEVLAVRGKTTAVPPLAVGDFEDQVLQAASAYTAPDLLHWFKYGNGPVKEAAKTIAQEVASTKPRSLAGVLADLARHDRLAGAVPFVSQLVSALSLPPRRLAHNELPLGGYSDVTTTGNPEQILPSQFALDDLEFLRRYAERELLYFRREEPHAQTREELVVLLDQGVRTWGVVRLVLTAAVFALGKMADRRKLPFLVASTSTGGAPCDPVTSADDALAAALGASDLSANPGRALERILEEPAATTRDVVLLTHPRNLTEGDVAAAAKRAGDPTRLFALGVTERGDVEFSQIKHGVPVPLSRFHVDLDVSKPPLPAPAVDPRVPWRGDVEPVGFPFRFGITAGHGPFRFDFDLGGKWLLAASANGMLHAVRTDGFGFEVLPRGFCRGQVLTDVRQVKGVADGFVVVGLIGADCVGFHYHFGERRCSLFVLGDGNWLPDGTHYYPDLHTVVVLEHYYGKPVASAIDLATHETHCPHRAKPLRHVLTTADIHLTASASVPLRPTPIPSRAAEALARAAKGGLPRTTGVDVLPPSNYPCSTEHWVGLDPITGDLWGTLDEGKAFKFAPHIEGKPLLKGQKLVSAWGAEDTLAVLWKPIDALPNIHRRRRLSVFIVPPGKLAGDYSQPREQVGVALSSDGRLLALQTGANEAEVRAVADCGRVCAVVPRGGCHSNVEIHLGEFWLSIELDLMINLFRWDNGVLSNAQGRGSPTAFLVKQLPPDMIGPSGPALRPGQPSWLAYDRNRFTRFAVNTLVAACDRFGQIALFDHGGDLVCMIFTFRQQVAAWLPEGTGFGAPALLGGSPTPGAAAKIGRALHAASRRRKQEERTDP